MAVIAADIQDNADNATRFVILGRERPRSTGRDRTSLVFSLAADRPGGLLAALHPFADRNINLTRIESRPTKATLGNYWFLIDCEGHLEDPPVAAAVGEVRGIAVELRVLGSYPRA
jgi:prephenate dehydratase